MTECANLRLHKRDHHKAFLSESGTVRKTPGSTKAAWEAPDTMCVAQENEELPRNGRCHCCELVEQQSDKNVPADLAHRRQEHHATRICREWEPNAGVQ